LEDDLEETLQRNQSLEQTITRLEIGLERAKTEAQRELNAKDTEITELRAQYQRRLRAFEDQVNDLSDSNNSLVKQNRLLEQRARQLELQSQSCVI
jgi:chromosome segregation ATPase